MTDTNDQSPMFVESSLSAVVAEEAPFGATVTTLQVCMFASQLLYAVYSCNNHHVTINTVLNRDSVAGLFCTLTSQTQGVYFNASKQAGVDCRDGTCHITST